MEGISGGSKARGLFSSTRTFVARVLEAFEANPQPCDAGFKAELAQTGFLMVARIVG